MVGLYLDIQTKNKSANCNEFSWLYSTFVCFFFVVLIFPLALLIWKLSTMAPQARAQHSIDLCVDFF